jgi:lipoprotein-anchoring transpeptidase ErfK/SrfK
MPFHDGQGLHDASWRTTFGGNIYQTNGSHGCVNLPEDAAQVIYENAEANMPILLYK